jgi:uncharacterized protein YgiM (DUF1202 family)
MKKNCWLILGAMLSTSLMAQQATNPVPSGPIETPGAGPAAALAPAAATTNAPSPEAGKQKAGKKKSQKAPKKKAAAKKPEAVAELKTVPLVPGPAEVVATHVNVRGQAKLKSEVVTQVDKGQKVTVIQEIVHNNSGPEEPSAWAKISLPPGAHAWVNNTFINASNNTVRPRRLRLRSGPGENYSSIGMLHRDDVVKPLNTKGDWTEIEPPADAYAFVAAQFLTQEAPSAPEPTPVPPEPAPTPEVVATAPTVAPPPTEAPPVPPPAEIPAVTNTPPPAPPEPAVEEPPPPRIVQREGIVRGMTSIQAPSRFVLVSPDNGRDIDYLYTTSKELDLRRYKGLRIIVTGDEGLDERWGNTPVLTIKRIQVLE